MLPLPSAEGVVFGGKHRVWSRSAVVSAGNAGVSAEKAMVLAGGEAPGFERRARIRG
jgi:hypothetical protein